MREGKKMTFDLRSKEIMRVNQLKRKGRSIPSKRHICAKALGRESTTVFKYLFIYLVPPGLSCGTRDLHCRVRALSCGMQDLVP